MSATLRALVASTGWTGHLFPALALARDLDARGHDVLVETFDGWRDVVEKDLGLGFAEAPEQIAFGQARAGSRGPSLAEAARDLDPLLRDLKPDVVVHDMWTLAPALAAERAGVSRATLIPHPYPVREPGLPLYPLGLLPPRTPVGRGAWSAIWHAVGTRLPNTRLRRVRADLNATRARLGLEPVAGYDGQISGELALVATLPQLEYPRRWPAHVHVTGPMPFELPHDEIDLPPGDDPLVLVASSTGRDPEHELAAVAIEALKGEPVRVVVALNRHGAAWSGPAAANATVLDWVSYSQLMPLASAVVCHGGHGTIARALAAGAPLLVSPRAGDQAENGARVAWAGAGLMLPDRLLAPPSLRVALRRLLSDSRFASRARSIRDSNRGADGAATGAGLVEDLARAAA